MKRTKKQRWNRKSYDALHNWAGPAKKDAEQILINCGLSDVVQQLRTAKTLGVWYRLTCEAAKAVGPQIVKISAKSAENELGRIAK